MPIYHEWIGTLEGLVNAQIRAQVSGYLLTQNYREGDSVKTVTARLISGPLKWASAPARCGSLRRVSSRENAWWLREFRR